MKSYAFVMAAILCAAPLAAEDTAADQQWKQDMEQKMEALTREVEKYKHGPAASGEKAPAVYESKYGFSPSASKVYHADRGVTFGGYGEMLVREFNNERDDGTASGSRRVADFLRAILYTGYKFNDKILFNSEIEYEHASTGSGRGEVSVEFAYLDFLLSQPAAVRAGLLLVPMGFVNELHEPTVFHGAVRPSVETNIIPTTWRENGMGLFGEAGPFSYRTYVLAGMQATTNSGVSGFSASGYRGGRTKGAQSLAEDVAWVGRVDFNGIPGTVIGGSLYTGQAGQNATTGGMEIDAPLTIWEVHGSAEYYGLELRTLYTQSTLGDAALINNANTLTGSSSVGERAFGGYAQLAYNVLSLTNSTHYLAPFVRYERYDTQQQVPAGFSESGANDKKEYTIGLTYKPIPQVVIKGEYQDIDNAADTGVNQINFALGYIF